ncbi:MAG: helical backbone metal receptor [Bacteroidota bacterium]
MSIRSIDQLGREVLLEDYPKRIISLVPSQTELLFELGLADQLIGRTKFCIHPSNSVTQIPSIGGTKKVRIDEVRSLKPDLIIVNKEENEKDQIDELSTEFKVWVSDISDFNSALKMIHLVGHITDTERKAEDMITQIKKIAEMPASKEIPTAVYLIWKKPMMTVGGDTFISDMIGKAGFSNVYKSFKRYPEISMDEIKEKQPDYLFLSSEPFPFNSKHIEEFQRNLDHTKVVLVDGEMFSWYGSRMLKAFSYFKELRKELDLLD